MMRSAAFERKVEAEKDRWETAFRQAMLESDYQSLPCADSLARDDPDREEICERELENQVAFIRTWCEYQLKGRSRATDLKNLRAWLRNQMDYDEPDGGQTAFNLVFQQNGFTPTVNINSWDDIDLYEVWQEARVDMIDIRSSQWKTPTPKRIQEVADRIVNDFEFEGLKAWVTLVTGKPGIPGSHLLQFELIVDDR